MKNIYACLFLFLAFSAVTFAQVCDVPENFQLDEFRSLSWSSVENAEMYRLQYRELGTVSWQNLEITDTTYQFNNMEDCLALEYRVRTICTDGTTSFPTDEISEIGECMVCQEDIYCDVVMNSSFYYIDQVQIAGFTNNTMNGINGYQSFLESTTGRFIPGSTVAYAISPSINVDSYYGIFIDYNGDGDFDDLYENVFANTTPTINGVIGEFEIPKNIKIGSTRMRIQMRAFDVPALNPCGGNNINGEIEDYCITFYSPCDEDFNFKLTEILEGEAHFEISDIDDVEAFNYRYKKTADGESAWDYLSTIENEIGIGDLENCTEYEIEIRTVCTSDTSSYKKNITFFSYCTNANQDEEILDFTLYPNPWSDALRIDLQLNERTDFSIQAYDLNGRVYELTPSQVYGSGEHSILIDNQANLPKGLYLITINTGHDRFVKKVLKL